MNENFVRQSFFIKFMNNYLLFQIIFPYFHIFKLKYLGNIKKCVNVFTSFFLILILFSLNAYIY